MHAISDDLGMRYTGSFSAGMQDLIKPEGQQKDVLTLSLLLLLFHFVIGIEEDEEADQGRY